MHETLRKIKIEKNIRESDKIQENRWYQRSNYMHNTGHLTERNMYIAEKENLYNVVLNIWCFGRSW